MRLFPIAILKGLSAGGKAKKYLSFQGGNKPKITSSEGKDRRQNNFCEDF